jgi:hypothetical protein
MSATLEIESHPVTVLIGDVRRKGQYTPLVKDVLNFPYGEIRSIIIKIQHHCSSDRKSYGRMEDVPIRHEYCIVFKKRTDSLPERRTHEQYRQMRLGGG